MIAPDLAELVDNPRVVGELRPAQQLVQQRGLAAAQKARQDRDGNALFGGGLCVAHRSPYVGVGSAYQKRSAFLNSFHARSSLRRRRLSPASACWARGFRGLLPSSGRRPPLAQSV